METHLNRPAVLAVALTALLLVGGIAGTRLTFAEPEEAAPAAISEPTYRPLPPVDTHGNQEQRVTNPKQIKSVEPVYPEGAKEKGIEGTVAVEAVIGADGRVTEARVVRQAELALEAPADLPAKERELGRLDWSSLSREERVLCPPIVVLAGSEALPGISRLLTSDLPVKVIMLDDCDLLASGGDPLLLSLAHRSAYVLSTSVAHPDHLFEGPAFITEAPSLRLRKGVS